MAKSLRDQLINAGAADASKNNKRGKKKKQPKAAKKDRAPGSMSAGDNTPNAAQLRAREQAERDRELNRKRQAQLAEREIAAQIRQLIERNSIDLKPKRSPSNDDSDASDDSGQLDYNFSDDGIIRKITLPANLHRRVTVGSMAIARLDDRYHVIVRAVADKIIERDDGSIVVLNDADDTAKSPTSDEDDEYAGFEVPDDLMW